MAGISKVPGPSGSSDSSNSDKVNSALKKNFGDLMKVGETDADQKKKKKQKGEAEEERKTESILAQGEKIQKMSPGSLAKFEKETQKIEKTGESEKRQPKHERRTSEEIEEASSATSSSKIDKNFDMATEDAKQDEITLERKAKASQETPQEESSPTEEQEKKFETKKVAQKKKETKVVTSPPTPLQSTPVIVPNLLSPASGVTPIYTSLKPELLALFERLIGSMSIMNTSGITETTIELNASEFSTFAGAKIVITEHTTAPKIFNIEFLGTAQTVALFNDSSASLVAAFKNGNYAFQVNRIDASLLKTDRPLFHRKEETKDKQEKGEDTLR